MGVRRSLVAVAAANVGLVAFFTAGLVLVAALVAWFIASRSIGSDGRHQP